MTLPRLANERVPLYRSSAIAAGSSRARGVDRPLWAVARAKAHIN
jgi:hypothetical protein